jgi:hypothetical protein
LFHSDFQADQQLFLGLYGQFCANTKHQLFESYSIFFYLSDLFQIQPKPKLNPKPKKQPKAIPSKNRLPIDLP